MPPRIPLPRQLSKKPEPPQRKPLPVPLERSVDFCRVFVDGKRLPGNARVGEAIEATNTHDNAFVWLSLKAPSIDQMERIASLFDIDDLIVDDVVDAHQRPKIERYDEQLFMVVRSVHYRDDEEVADALSLIHI